MPTTTAAAPPSSRLPSACPVSQCPTGSATTRLRVRIGCTTTSAPSVERRELEQRADAVAGDAEQPHRLLEDLDVEARVGGPGGRSRARPSAGARCRTRRRRQRAAPASAAAPPSTARRLGRLRRWQEPVEHPHPELQAVDRHPLVDAVEHAGEVEVGRELQRREPEAADAELARRTWRRCRRRAVRDDRARPGPRRAATRSWRRPARRRTSVSRAMSRWTCSRVTSGPSSSSICREELVLVARAGSGRRCARCASPGMTLTL